MYLRTLLLTSLSLTTLNPIISSLTKTNNQNIHNITNTMDDIAKKYESPKIDLTTITYDNFLNDIKNSDISKTLSNEINITFQIKNTNVFSDTRITYAGQSHGEDSRQAYENKLKSDALNIFSYLSMLTLISNVAHYYGDNTTMDEYIRDTALSNDIYILKTFNTNIKNSLTSLNLKGNFATKINDWSDNIPQIINNAVNQNYSSDPLLSSYNNINYNGLTTYNSTLHAWDDYSHDYLQNHAIPNWCTEYKTVSDWFCLGTSDNNQLFKISMDNSSSYYENSYLLYEEIDINFSDPTNFDIVMN